MTSVLTSLTSIHSLNKSTSKIKSGILEGLDFYNKETQQGMRNVVRNQISHKVDKGHRSELRYLMKQKMELAYEVDELSSKKDFTSSAFATTSAISDTVKEFCKHKDFFLSPGCDQPTKQGIVDGFFSKLSALLNTGYKSSHVFAQGSNHSGNIVDITRAVVVGGALNDDWILAPASPTNINVSGLDIRNPAISSLIKNCINLRNKVTPLVDADVNLIIDDKAGIDNLAFCAKKVAEDVEAKLVTFGLQLAECKDKTSDVLRIGKDPVESMQEYTQLNMKQRFFDNIQQTIVQDTIRSFSSNF